MPQSPIGVFDSGVGGLSVLREIRTLLPHENLCYVADSGYAPYGDKSQAYIVDRSEAIVRYFLSLQAKAIVVACNTATSMAVDQLRTWCPIPIIAMEPAIKPAALQTRSGVVGVLATSRTVSSNNVNRLIAEHGQGVKVILQACTGFVEQVERGDLVGKSTRQLVEHHLTPLLAEGVDTLVLGCTHYPFLQKVIAEVAGEGVHIIDPSAAIAKQLMRKLSEQQRLNTSSEKGVLTILSSGNPVQSQMLISQLLEEPVSVSCLP